MTSWGENTLLRATVHVDLQPCERAQAVAENLKQQVPLWRGASGPVEVHLSKTGGRGTALPVSTEYSTGLPEPRRGSKRETIGKRSTVGRRRRQGLTEARYDVGGAAKRRKPEKLRRWHPYTTTNAQACAKGNDSGAR